MLMTRGKVHDRTIGKSDMPHNAVTATVEVDDPYPVPGVSRTIKATASLRDDPLRRLRVRRQISEECFQAGRHWQRLYERAEISNLQGVDTTREYVDGGRFPELLTDARQKAVVELARLSRPLGIEGEALIRDVLGKGLFVRECAISRGITAERAVRRLSDRLKESLEILAFEFGFIHRRPNL